jgi:hypothetical protein
VVAVSTSAFRFEERASTFNVVLFVLRYVCLQRRSAVLTAANSTPLRPVLLASTNLLEPEAVRLLWSTAPEDRRYASLFPALYVLPWLFPPLICAFLYLGFTNPKKLTPRNTNLASLKRALSSHSHLARGGPIHWRHAARASSAVRGSAEAARGVLASAHTLPCRTYAEGVSSLLLFVFFL